MNECSEFKLAGDRFAQARGATECRPNVRSGARGRRDYVGMTTGTSESCRLAATPKLAQSGQLRNSPPPAGRDCDRGPTSFTMVLQRLELGGAPAPAGQSGRFK